MVVFLKDKVVFNVARQTEPSDRDRLTILFVCQTLNMENVLVIVGERLLLLSAWKSFDDVQSNKDLTNYEEWSDE